MRISVLFWLGFFLLPLIAMIVLDGFCSGRELCRAGLTFTILLYAIGIAAFFVSLLLSRLIFRVLHTGAAARVQTLKFLFLIPLLPGLIVLGLLFAGLLGRLG
jgi:hypothetical protein